MGELLASFVGETKDSLQTAIQETNVWCGAKCIIWCYQWERVSLSFTEEAPPPPPTYSAALATRLAIILSKDLHEQKQNLQKLHSIDSFSQWDMFCCPKSQMFVPSIFDLDLSKMVASLSRTPVCFLILFPQTKWLPLYFCMLFLLHQIATFIMFYN